MENSVKLLLSLTVTLLCVRPAPSLLCEMSVESDQFCSKIMAAPSDMKCFISTVTGPPQDPFKMVVKGIAGTPLCKDTSSEPQHVFLGAGLQTANVHTTCCGTDYCNNVTPQNDDSAFPNPDHSDHQSSCVPPNHCPDGLLEQLHLVANGSVFIRPAICN